MELIKVREENGQQLVSELQVKLKECILRKSEEKIRNTLGEIIKKVEKVRKA